MPMKRGSHEPSDVNAKGVAWSAVLIVLSLTGLLFVLVAALHVSGRQELYESNRQPAANRPPIPLRYNRIPYRSLERYREDQFARLTSYGWVQRTEGTIHIPIDVAIKLTAARGLPHRKRKDAAK